MRTNKGFQRSLEFKELIGRYMLGDKKKRLVILVRSSFTLAMTSSFIECFFLFQSKELTLSADMK